MPEGRHVSGPLLRVKTGRPASMISPEKTPKGEFGGARSSRTAGGRERHLCPANLSPCVCAQSCFPGSKNSNPPPPGAFLPPPTAKRSKSHLPELPQDASTTSATRDSHPQPASSSYQPDLGVRCKSQDVPPALQLETPQGSSSFTGQLLGPLCHPTCSQIGSTCWQKALGQD